MAPKKDPFKAKQAKQKKLAIGGGVLLLALLAFQVPRTMKMLHPAGNVTTSASTAPATTTPAGATPLAPPTLDGSSGSSAAASPGASSGSATSADGVVDASSPLPASSGQLISFNRFKTKDPFVQQVQDCTSGCSGAAPSASAAGSASGSGSSAPTAVGAKSAGSSGSGGAPAGSGTTTAGAPLKVTTASILVNGTRSKVAVGQTFPAANPVFVLSSVTPTAAKIAISGGSLEGGAPTVTLGLGKTLKLQNTADGTLFTLKLVGTSG